MTLDGQIAVLRSNYEGYPQALLGKLSADAPAQFCAAGPSAVLNQPMTGFFCSSRCPGSIVLKTFDAITRIRDAGAVLIGGFHSVMEWECLRILLRGRQPVVWVPARSIKGMRLKPEVAPVFEAGRLLILSPFSAREKRVTAILSDRRNHFIATLAGRSFIPHAVPGGKTAALARELLVQGKEVHTIDDSYNRELISMGAIPIDNEYFASLDVDRCANAVL